MTSNFSYNTSFYTCTHNCIRVTYTFDTTNHHDNVRDEKDTVLFVFVMQLMNTQPSRNLGMFSTFCFVIVLFINPFAAVPTPLVVANFGAHTINFPYPLIITEPDLRIELTLSRYTADGYDRIDAKVNISHTSISTSAAYDIVSSVVMPEWFHLITGNVLQVLLLILIGY